MKVEYVEESSVRKALVFEVEPEVVDTEIEARAREYARKVKLPGFRPGKIPLEVVKRRFRGQVLEDAAEAIVNRVVFGELEGRGLRPLASPKVTDLKINESQPMTFRAVFETLPLVDVPEYRGLSAKVRAASVAEADVDAELERLREQAARYDPVEGRTSQSGDFVLLDLTWRPEGGKPGRDENALVEVGHEGNHADLNAALVGLAPGDAREVRVSYPADHAGSLAGKTVDYVLTLKSIKRKVLPALDDEFAKDLGELASLAELREDVRKRLMGVEERRADREAKAALVEALVEQASFEVPEALVERHMTARTESAARGLAYQGIDPSRIGMDWRQYRESQRDDALKAAKADILLDEIARREGIETTGAELDAELDRYAERLGKSRDALRAQMEKEGDLTALGARIREEKTLDLLKANARLDFE